MTEENRITYIYGLIDPQTGIVRYIGKADKPRIRYNGHISRARRLAGVDSPSVHWIHDLLKIGLYPQMQIICTTSRSNWEESEIFWIAYMEELHGPLLNVCLGGKGGPPLYKSKPNATNSKRYMVQYPDGTEEEIRSLKKFCKENKLSYCRMVQVAGGKSYWSNGYRVRKIDGEYASLENFPDIKKQIYLAPIVRAEYAEGLKTAIEIADKYGVTAQTVRTWCKNIKITRKKESERKLTWEEGRALRKQAIRQHCGGKTSQDIAKDLGVHIKTIQKWIREDHRGIPETKRMSKTQIAALAPTGIVLLRDGYSLQEIANRLGVSKTTVSNWRERMANAAD